jgi:hypothetical protein
MSKKSWKNKGKKTTNVLSAILKQEKPWQELTPKEGNNKPSKTLKMIKKPRSMIN